MLTKPPYMDIGNPKMAINPLVEDVYDELEPDMQVISEIFDLSGFEIPKDKIFLMPGPWYWLTV